jgi:hypothetical protein
MLKKIKDYFDDNRRLIIITFEIFWIVVFLFEKVTNEKSVDIPQFIYVNF